MSQPHSDSRGTKINRRRILRSATYMGAASIVGFGAVTARHQDSGPQEKCPCIDDDTLWGKYNFIIDESDTGEIVDCYFEHTEGEDLVEITGWEDKEGEECEPIIVHYTAKTGYAVTYVCAFGGTDNEDDDVVNENDSHPNGTFDKELIAPSGQQAAISNLTFCVEEIPERNFQIDLIHGDEKIAELVPHSETYGAQHRLLQVRWSDPDDPEGRLEVGHFDNRTTSYQECYDTGLAITQDITVNVAAGTATACIDPGAACDVSDFSLVVYTAPGHSWDPDEAHRQEISDYDLAGDPDTGCFTVDLPGEFEE